MATGERHWKYARVSSAHLPVCPSARLPGKARRHIDSSVRSMPADFLITPDGRIRFAHYGTHIGDHLALSAGTLDVPGRAA